MTREAATEIAAWSYDAPYTLYNHAPEDRADLVAALTDPANAYQEIAAPALGLIGFFCIGIDARVPGGSYAGEGIDLGLGLRPDLTGQGRGHSLAEAVLERAALTSSHARFRVTVAAFNQRARRLWDRVGFEMESCFTRDEDRVAFVIMTRSRESSLTTHDGR